MAAPLHALSCMPYGLPEALHDVSTSKDGYIAVTGTLSFEEDKLPFPDWDNQQDTPPLTKIKANFKGKVLGRTGFKKSFSTALIINVHCYGPWCAGAKSNKQVLAFLKQSPNGYSLEISPCGDHLFYKPSKADLNTVKRCYLAKQCPKPNQN